MKKLIGNHYTSYTFRRAEAVRRLVDEYGVDHRDRHNWTPLMLAARFGNEAAVGMLADMGANPSLVNSAGLTAYQNRPPQGNRRLFKRTSRGFYVLNPSLKIHAGDAWLDIYDLLEPQALFLGLRLSGRVPAQFRAMIERDRLEFQEHCLAVLAADETRVSVPSGDDAPRAIR